MKIIRIEKCGECPFCKEFPQFSKRTGWTWRCQKMGRNGMKVISIHPSCPLPDDEVKND